LGVGIILAMFGASRLFIVIDKCITIVYRLPERTFLRQNLLAFGMLFIFIILIIVMLVASSAPSALISIIPGGGSQFGVFIAGILSSLLVAFVLFEVIYWVVPNKKMSFKTTWCGALVAACTLEIFIILFPLYVRRFMGNYAGKLIIENIYLINIFLYLKKK
jgi:membrane protein